MARSKLSKPKSKPLGSKATSSVLFPPRYPLHSPDTIGRDYEPIRRLPPTAVAPQKRAERTYIRTLPSEAEAWQARAAELGLTVSEWARRLLNLDVASSDRVDVAAAGLRILDPRIGIEDATNLIDARNRVRRDERRRLKFRFLAIVQKPGVTIEEVVAGIKAVCAVGGTDTDNVGDGKETGE